DGGDHAPLQRDDAGERGGVEAVDLQHLQVGGGGEVVHVLASGVVDVGGDLAAAHGQVRLAEPRELGEQFAGGTAVLGQCAGGRRGAGGRGRVGDRGRVGGLGRFGGLGQGVGRHGVG